jgi:hypothetical protein
VEGFVYSQNGDKNERWKKKRKRKKRKKSTIY